MMAEPYVNAVFNSFAAVISPASAVCGGRSMAGIDSW